MEELIKLPTAFSDVQVVYLNRGATSNCEYLWMEKDEKPYGISMTGLVYEKKHHGEVPQCPNPDLDTVQKIIILAGKQVMNVFDDVLLDKTHRSFDLNEIDSVLGPERMKEIARKVNAEGTGVLFFEKKIREYITQNKSMDGLESLIFTSPLLTRLFVQNPTKSLNEYSASMSNNMIAAIITDDPSRDRVFTLDSMKLLREKQMMETIYTTYKGYEQVIKHLNDPKWWGSMAFQLLEVFNGKSSVKMVLVSDPEEFTFPVNYITTFHEKVFTPKGLRISYDVGSGVQFFLQYTKNALKNDSTLLYEDISYLKFRNKIVWKNPLVWEENQTPGKKN